VQKGAGLMGKIDDLELQKMLDQGLNQVKIASYFKVTRSAVCKRIKWLSENKTKVTALEKANDIVENKLDAMAQLRRINTAINNELSYIQENIQNASNKERKKLQDQQLKHVSEIRKQLGLLLDIAQTFYNAEEVAAFQEIVLEEIGYASPEVRERILQRLKERRVARPIHFPA
jgi:predicted transcriptional regulator